MSATKNEFNNFILDDIRDNINRIESIINTDIFTVENINHPLVKSAFIEVIICLYDLLKKCEKFSSRISFTDNVIFIQSVEETEIKDITDLVRFMRNVSCHISSCDNFIDKNKHIKSVFNRIYGDSFHQIAFNNATVILSCDYPDDVAFFFGQQRIYLKRHIIRAFEEVKQQLSSKV